jgi:hypothetical protein
MSVLKTLVVTVAVVTAYHFLLAPRIYVADPVTPLERAKELVLEGKMTEGRFKALVKDMEETIAGKCPSWRHNVVLVKKTVFAGGEDIDLGRLLPDRPENLALREEKPGKAGEGGGRAQK